MKQKRRKRCKIKKWKAYLYNLVDRFKVYQQVNQGKYTRLFKFKPGEIKIMKDTLQKFGWGGVWERENNFHRALFYLKFVEQNFKRVSLRDVRIAHKISPLKKIGEHIMSELMKVKGFGKEVGLTFADMKGLSEEALVAKIVESVDSDADYTKPFYKWYEKLEENYPSLFEDVADGDEESEVDMDEVIDGIENADDLDELKELLELPIFADDKKKLKKIKDLEELQTAMTEIIEAASEEDEEEEKEDKKDKKKKDKKDKGKGKKKDEPSDELIELVKEADDVEGLKEICQDEDYAHFFKEISLRGRQKFENLQAKMLEAIGVEVETEGENGEDLEESLNEMSEKDLKAKAKELDIKPPVIFTDKKKKDLIKQIIEKCSACESEKEEEVQITPALIKKAVLAKDMETLLAAAEALGYKPKLMEKKNSRKLAEALMPLITENKKEKKKGKDKVASIYSTIEALVKEGTKKKAIIKEVTPLFEERGQDDEDFIKEKVSAMIEIIEMETEE